MFPQQRPMGGMRQQPMPQPAGTSESMARPGMGRMGGPTTMKGAPSSDLKRMAILKHLKGDK